MQTKPSFDVLAVADYCADADTYLAAPVELDLTTLRFVSGGLPRAGWGSSATVATAAVTELPRAGW